MTILKFIPTDLSHRDWQTSRYHGEVVVRAESEERARKFLSDTFRTAATKPPGANIQGSPWLQSDLVSVVEVKGSSYPMTGPEEILDPEEARAYNDA